MILEAAIDNFATAQASVLKGANRLEVCSNLQMDGLTPSVDLFVQCKSLGVPCFAMVRPVRGDFIITEDTFALMQQEIQLFKSLQADGIVLGFLNHQREIDIDKVQSLVQLAEPLPVTFHKAIDTVNDILSSTKDLLSTGISRILTSGGKSTVEQGSEVIKQMYQVVEDKIILVAGGKVNFQNLPKIRAELPFCEFHGRNIVQYSKIL